MLEGRNNQRQGSRFVATTPFTTPGARRCLALLAATLLVPAAFPGPSRAGYQQEAVAPHWIWHPSAAAPSATPAETRYFRKEFRVKEDSRLVLDVTADNAFSLYLDGKLVAEGNDWAAARRVETQVGFGAHVLAARARNEAQGPAGLLVRGGVLPLGQGVPVHTDTTWRTAEKVPDGDGWTRVGFDDRGWARAVDLGVLGTGPWGQITFGVKDPAERFRVPQGFTVQTVAQPAVTGSVIALTFDDEGRPCVSIEGGPIARLHDDDHDGRYDRRQPIAPPMANCQGLAFLHGRLYAVGDGPQGTGLYRLTDPNRDGVFDKSELVRLSKGGMGEHGPHAITLGPDGRLYFNNGNHAHLMPPIDPASPVNVAYEGELLPHYNDARGHAAGIMAPGGEIYRSDDEGRTWKRAVAGFRNQYDFAFNSDGEIFTFDSDMEWDVGLPWYRPVRVCHGTLGAEFGWRNGSGKWPAYYPDSLPAALDLGRGSPTGVTFYQASQFPAAYFDRLLICDWSQGRILAVKLDRRGGSYAASAEELVSGQPLNCTDIEVGPDGAVYFSTGGRGTEGGLFRLSWNQQQNRARTEPRTPWDEAIAIDSPQSSFSRRKIETLRNSRRAEWDEALAEAARDPRRNRPVRDRIRALDLLCQFGPGAGPGEDLLIALAADRAEQVRARAVTLLGYHASAAARQAMVKALADADPFVRRHACEALMQQPARDIPAEQIIPLLSDPDRWVRYAARVALEHADLAPQRERLLRLADPRARVHGMLALVRSARPDASLQRTLLAGEIELLAQRPAPALELDLLRLIGLTFLLGPAKAEAPGARRLGELLLARFSTAADTPNNREIARLLAFLDEPNAVKVILAHQAAAADRPAQIHDAYCLRAMKAGWTPEARRQLWAWYETASHWEGGFSMLGYLDYMIQELVGLLDPKEREDYLAKGESYPFPTRVLVRTLEIDGQGAVVASLVGLYQRILKSPSAGAHGDDLRALILEKLGRTSVPAAHEALRSLAVQDPKRLDQIARALSERPGEGDLPVLVAGLDSRDPNTISLVTAALRKLPAVPRGPEALGKLIHLAQRSGATSRETLDDLAARWTGVARPASSLPFHDALAAWESVYRRLYPAAPLAAVGPAGSQSYDLPQLIDNVIRAEVMKTASTERGVQVIVKARCLDCHKFGDKGAGLGPDLTTVNSRFRPAEILDSIVTPSKVVSDQYRSLSVATGEGRVYSGMPVVSDGPNLVLLLSDGTKVTIPRTEIEEQKTSAVSVMPEGLLNPLSYQEIADLLALFNSMPRVTVPPEGAAKGQ